MIKGGFAEGPRDAARVRRVSGSFFRNSIEKIDFSSFLFVLGPILV